jgi:hypothetical protein
MTSRRALSRFPVPDERAAEARAWGVIRGTFQEREPAAHRRSYRRPVAAATAVLVLAVSLVLSPAGATVGRLISRAFGVRHASPALISLPASGRLLVSGASGTWTVGPQGSKRRLGRWTTASWSPHGRYLAVARGDELVAVSPFGIPQWGLERPRISDPRWFPSSGYRVAYLSGAELRVVAGDGTQDHLVAGGVARVAPAWRPGHPYQLAYVTAGGRLMVRDGDAGVSLWSARPGVRVRQLAWSADGQRLLALSVRKVSIYSAGGRLLSVKAVPGDASIESAAFSPDGRSLSLVSGGPGSAVIVLSLSGHSAPRRVLTGAGLGQVAFSPNGRWLLITWPAADQWVFVRVVGAPRIAAVSRIAQHFSVRGKPQQFPRLDGWCCAATGAAG